jgi:hypothetical protein
VRLTLRIGLYVAIVWKPDLNEIGVRRTPLAWAASDSTIPYLSEFSHSEPRPGAYRSTEGTSSSRLRLLPSALMSNRCASASNGRRSDCFRQLLTAAIGRVLPHANALVRQLSKSAGRFAPARDHGHRHPQGRAVRWVSRGAGWGELAFAHGSHKRVRARRLPLAGLRDGDLDGDTRSVPLKIKYWRGA